MITIDNEYTIQTGTHVFDYETPENSTMTIEDIAHALSNICRWGGHCNFFYSVAQHALMVCDLALEISEGNPLVGFLALHHDDHESVRGDIPSPRKRYLKKHGQLFLGEERAEDEYIYSGLLGVEWPPDDAHWAIVKEADHIALETEREFLKPVMSWWRGEPARHKLARSKDYFWSFVDIDDEAEFLAKHTLLKGRL
jgi:hypothetical protein